MTEEQVRESSFVWITMGLERTKLTATALAFRAHVKPTTLLSIVVHPPENRPWPIPEGEVFERIEAVLGIRMPPLIEHYLRTHQGWSRRAENDK